MTYPRAHLVDEENGGIYHCVNRCVRRAWLCGEDALTGRSFEHRRQWVEERILFLSRIFSVDLYNYSVMHNHYHVVIETLPHAVHRWSDTEVVDRWIRLLSFKSDEARDLRRAALLEDSYRVAELRKRLGSLSWFMAQLNESIARRANAEDDCKGHFWEGRFKSTALLDTTAVLAAMAYVDLNPYRAGLVRSPERARHTAVARRINEQAADAEPLVPLERFGLDLTQYVALLYWTAGIKHGHETDNLRAHAAINVERIEWKRLVDANHDHRRAYGTVDTIREFARSIRQQWVKGYLLRQRPT